MAPETLGGVTYFPVTPYDSSGDLDTGRLRERIATVTGQAEFTGIFPMGSIGEFPYLSVEERKRVVDVVVDEVGGSIPVIPGASAISTRQTIELARYADDAGADGVLVNPQSYYPPTEDEIFEHYRRVSEAIDIPVFAYNNPNTTKVDMSIELVKRLEELDGIPYYKSGTFDLRKYRRLALELDEMRIFSAPPHMFEKLAWGADGWTGPVSNIDPEAAIEMYQTFEEGDLYAAREQFSAWHPLLDFFFTDHLASTMKAILELQGEEVGDPRPPIQPLGRERKEDLREAMVDLGLI